MGAPHLTPQQRRALAEAQRDPWLPLVLAAGAVAGLLLSMAYPLGWAA